MVARKSFVGVLVQQIMKCKEYYTITTIADSNACFLLPQFLHDITTFLAMLLNVELVCNTFGINSLVVFGRRQ